MGLNAWVAVDRSGIVHVALPWVEMGQGVSTALPMLVAEELDVALGQVRTEQPGNSQLGNVPTGETQAGRARLYGNRAVFGASWWFHPDNQDSWLARRMVAMGQANGSVLGIRITGGSSSVRDAFDTLREAGAAARLMLVSAAAAHWGVPASECSTAAGAVVHTSGRKLGYGALVEQAARLPVPGKATPKPASKRTLVGSRPPRLDVPAKVNGGAIYGADVRLPGMLYGAVRGAPSPGGAIESIDKSLADKMPGVRAIVQYEALAGCAAGVGVVAQDSWQAQLALTECKVRWGNGGRASFDTDSLRKLMRDALDGAERGFVFHERGEGELGLARAARVVKADYFAPWLAHATMEPMNCTAQWLTNVPDGGDRLRIWVPTQAPSFVLETAARASRLAPEYIELQVTQVGGGFGRRLESDYVVPAIALARAVSPSPVQVQWSREEDITHDFYRPAAVCRLHAGLDEQGRVGTWLTRSVSDAITSQFLERNYPTLGKMVGMMPDRTQAEGLWDQPYEIENRRCEHVHLELPVPIGNWRSVGHSHMAFFAESFIDELAQAAGVDPFEYRRRMLEHHPRHLAVLELAAAKAGWGSPPASGRARGIALHESFGSIVAQVAEVSLNARRVRVHRVVCAIDCGTVVHPDIVAQQVEGSVVFALSACLYGEIGFRDGRTVQSNFPDYEMVRLREAPAVETWIVPSGAPPMGVGEPATPPLAPAVANAVFGITGKRLRELPIRLV